MKNFLGIDWGEKEIGLALAHAETRLALALAIFHNDESFWEKLALAISEHEVGSLVIGVPEYQEEGTMNKARAFADEVKKRLPLLDVSLGNEMFTSKMAGERLRETGKRAIPDHAEAARITLESWLEKETSKNASGKVL